MVKVKKPTGPIANQKLPEGADWKTYTGKFITFQKDEEIYYAHFQYSFFRGVHDIAVLAAHGDDRDIIILDFYPGLIQRLINRMDTMYAVIFPRLYRKRHPDLFSTKR